MMQFYLRIHGQSASSGPCQHANCKMQDLQRIQEDKLENLEM